MVSLCMRSVTCIILADQNKVHDFARATYIGKT
jgi:hypothetical protein